LLGELGILAREYSCPEVVIGGDWCLSTVTVFLGDELMIRLAKLCCPTGTGTIFSTIVV
jgi:hypothetical protein